MGVNPAAAGLLGGMGGGIVQAYATMGESIYLPTNRILVPSVGTSSCDDSNPCSLVSASDIVHDVACLTI